MQEADLDVLDAVQRRVLWLATAIVHHANRVRPNPSGIKVGGHQASSASMVSLMTALWFAHLQAPDRVSVKPHASPVLHAINFLLGRLDPGYLPRLREYGGPAVLSQSHARTPTRSTTRPAPSGSARPRRSGARWRTATWPGTSTCRSAGARSRCSATPSSTRARVGGDRRPDGRARWARCCGSSTSTASRSTAWCPTSPPGAWWACSRPPAGTPRRSSTAGACARSSPARRRGAARAHRRDGQRGVPAAAARRRRPAARAAARRRSGHRAADLRPRRARAAGHLPRPRRP